MTRNRFGGTSNDIAYSTATVAGRKVLALPDSRWYSGLVTPPALKYYDAETGGARYDDLLLNGVGVTEIPVPANGYLPAYYGPDGVEEMWEDDGDASTPRTLVTTTDRLAGPTGATGATGAPGGSDAATAGWVTSGALTVAALDAGGRINALAHGVKGDNATDDTAALNTLLGSLTAGTVFLPSSTFGPRTYVINSTITVPAGVHLELDTGTTLKHTVYNADAIVLGAGSKVSGGTIASPATWDGTNSGGWTYAVINVTGAGATVDGVTFDNVPRVGIGFRNVDGGTVVDCHIHGNYPSASFTGVETAHFGINFDCGPTGPQGDFIVADNHIDTCVQGLFCANYGTASPGGPRGMTITGNAFYSCWNHGIYADTGTGHVITGNNFNRCQSPVVISGDKHTLTGNTLTTGGTGTGADQVGISVRDATGCVVVGNTIQGDAGPGAVIISVSNILGTVTKDNVVAHNTIDVSGGTAIAIRVGGTACLTNNNNLVQGNKIRCVGKGNSDGLIEVTNDATVLGLGNQILDNTVLMLGVSHAIYVGYQSSVLVQGNDVRVGFDAASAITLAGVQVVGSTTTGTRIFDNNFVMPAAFGTNIAWRSIWEATTGITASIISRNTYSLSTTKATSVAKTVLASGSGSVVVDDIAPLTTTAVLDFPSIAAGANATLAVTLTGCVLNDCVTLGPPAAIEAGLVWNGFVLSANNVRVRVTNTTASAIDPASATWKVGILR